MRGRAHSTRDRFLRRPRFERCEIFAPPSDLLGVFFGGSLLVSLAADAAEADSVGLYRADDPSLPAEAAAYFTHPLRDELEQLDESVSADEARTTAAPFDALFADETTDHDWLRLARESFDNWLAQVVEQLYADNVASDGVAPLIALRPVVVADDAGPRIAA